MSSARLGGRSRPRGASRNPPTAPAENNGRHENHNPRPGTNGGTASVNGRGGTRGLANGGKGNATPRGNKASNSRQAISNTSGSTAPSRSGSTFGNGTQAPKANEAPDERFQRV